MPAVKVPLYQVDAFSGRLFGGNPAAVCPLDEWLDDRTMQAIAAENNLSETAFFIDRRDHYELRWFTPVMEVDLAGHPTLATAYVILHLLSPDRRSVRFETKSGPLVVEREGELLAMDFPALPPAPCEAPPDLITALALAPVEVLAAARDYFVVYESEGDIRRLDPDLGLIKGLDRLGLIVTAPGVEADFVSRFFAPKAGIAEDPVTGSAHCTLIPYWAERLGKSELEARQHSRRGGELFCTHRGERVKIAGRCALYLVGAIHL